MGINKVRIKFEGLLKLLEGTIVVTGEIELKCQCEAEIWREWIEFDAALRLGQSFWVPPHNEQPEPVVIMSPGVVGVELKRPIKQNLGGGPVPLIKGLHYCQRRVCVRKTFINLQSSECCGFGKRLGRQESAESGEVRVGEA